MFLKKKKPGQCYISCAELPFSAFIKALINKDYSGLIKVQGICDPLSAWETIYNEYLTISGDSQSKHILSLLKDVSFLTCRIQLAQLIIDRVSENYHAGLIKELQSMGYRMKYENGPDLQRDLQLTINQLKTQTIRLNQSKAELEEIQKESGSAPTVQDFDMQLSELSKFQGYYVDPDKTTVSAYCALVKRFKLYYKPQP